MAEATDPRPVAPLVGATALLAPPMAWALARLGYGLAVVDPLTDVAWLLAGAWAEEVVFRSGLLRWLRRRPALRRERFGLSAANTLSSAAFAAAHLLVHPPLAAIGVWPVSLILGAVFERRDRLGLPTALHASFNLLLYTASWLQAS